MASPTARTVSSCQRVASGITRVARLGKLGMAADEWEPGAGVPETVVGSAVECPAMQYRTFPGGSKNRVEVGIARRRAGDVQLEGVRLEPQTHGDACAGCVFER